MRSLLEISDFSKQDLQHVLEKIDSYVTDSSTWPVLGDSVASLFYEDSTRTRVSFELAALNLGMKHINIDIKNSSENKGEALLDTVTTLHAMGIRFFIIRHKSPDLIFELNQAVRTANFINAGSGMIAHPTQALLDLYTIKQRFGDFKKIKVAIVGDIKHSRVASSLITGLKLLEVGQITCAAPNYFKCEKMSSDVDWSDNLDTALNDADVVVALRVQKERLDAELEISVDDYQRDFRLSKEKLAIAKPHVVVMHPGPINRGIEMTSQVADGDNSLILNQVKNGVYARMAVFSILS